MSIQQCMVCKTIESVEYDEKRRTVESKYTHEQQQKKTNHKNSWDFIQMKLIYG